jgi:hypothetical protein
MVLPEAISYGKSNSRTANESIAKLTKEMSHLIGDDSFRLSQRRKLLELASQYARTGASYVTAKELLKKQSSGNEGTLPIDEDFLQLPNQIRKAG